MLQAKVFRSPKWPAKVAEAAVAYSNTDAYEATIQAAIAAIEARWSARNDAPAMVTPKECKAYVTLKLADRKQEVFACLFLDNRHRVIAYEEMFAGTVDGCSAHPREVVRQAIAHNAAAVILAHQHPSGVAEPSSADRAITLRLKDALGLIDVRVLDHLVVGGAQVTALSERGWI